MSIGNIDTNIEYSNIGKFRNYNGDEITPNNMSYAELVSNIKGAIDNIAEEARGWYDYVSSHEIKKANKEIRNIFNGYATAITNYNRDVSEATTKEELEKVSENFKSNFINRLTFTATVKSPGISYISSNQTGPFTHYWYDEATNQKKIEDDNGSYKLIGQLVNRVYTIFLEVLRKAKSIKEEKLKTLSAGVEPPKAGTPGTGAEPPKTETDPQKNIESRIRSLFNKKYRLEQKQASLINEIKTLTTEARRVYVRQFLNEDDRTTTATTSDVSGVTSNPSTSSSKIITVDSDNQIYIGLHELLKKADKINDYYKSSVVEFKKIAKRAKHLQELINGNIKNFGNMSMEDRISAFNNAKYDFDNQSNTTTPTKSSVLTPTAKTIVADTQKYINSYIPSHSYIRDQLNINNTTTPTSQPKSTTPTSQPKSTTPTSQPKSTTPTSQPKPTTATSGDDFLTNINKLRQEQQTKQRLEQNPSNYGPRLSKLQGDSRH